MGRLEATINTRSLITKSVSLLGSVGGTAADIAAVYKLMESRDVKPEIVEITFNEIGEGLNLLARGGVKGRQVAIL